MKQLFMIRRAFLQRLACYGAGFTLLANSKTSFADRKVILTNVRTSQSDTSHTRVVFDLSENIKHNIFVLTDPHRVVVDLVETQKSHALTWHQKGTHLLQGIRSAQRPTGELRVVLDLNDKTANPRSFVLQPDGDYGYRLVVDLHAGSLKPKPIVTQQQPKKAVVIALDPGHGGRDPGAIGKRGTREKDIVLAVARKMQKIINRTTGYQAILTRDNDQYIALRHRVKKARDGQADLFISLHADSFHNAKVKGASVYALSLNGASSEAARWIANKENKSDLVAGINLDDKDDLIASVLYDLSQTATIQDSLELGQAVLRQLEKVSPVNNRQVQQAGFAVLKAPDIPSILIETAFLSNPSEEKRLRNGQYQQKLANTIFAGIQSHIKQHQT